MPGAGDAADPARQGHKCAVHKEWGFQVCPNVWRAVHEADRHRHPLLQVPGTTAQWLPENKTSEQKWGIWADGHGWMYWWAAPWGTCLWYHPASAAETERSGGSWAQGERGHRLRSKSHHIILVTDTSHCDIPCPEPSCLNLAVHYLGAWGVWNSHNHWTDPEEDPNFCRRTSPSTGALLSTQLQPSLHQDCNHCFIRLWPPSWLTVPGCPLALWVQTSFSCIIASFVVLLCCNTDLKSPSRCGVHFSCWLTFKPAHLFIRRRKKEVLGHCQSALTTKKARRKHPKSCSW